MVSTKLRPRLPRRVTVIMSVAMLGVGAIAGQAALAAASDASGPACSSAGADGRGCASVTDAGIQGQAAAAVEGMARDGAIDQSQAEAIVAQIDAGSIDPKSLVGRGVVSESQMRAVADVIGDVKESNGG